MLSRREFLEQGVILAVAVSYDSVAPAPALAVVASDHPYTDTFLTIRDDNTIAFVCPNVEMGQSVYTSLVTIVAEELNTAPELFFIEFAPASRKYKSPSLGLQVTGGSDSITSRYLPLRQAGAGLRWLLMRAAAQNFKCKPEQVTLKDKTLNGPSTEQSMTFAAAAIAAKGLDFVVPELRPITAPRFVGQYQTRLDAKAKVTGAPIFGIDVEVKDALVAVVIRPPERGARLASYDAKKALETKGVVGVFPISTGLAIVAQKYWILRQVRELVSITWEAGPRATVSSESILANLEQLLNDGSEVSAVGKGQALTKEPVSDKMLQATYFFPYLAHATMEPQNCTARVDDKSCEIWAPTQSPGIAKEVALEVTGLSSDNITIHQTFLGGGFGRRLEQDYVREALQVAMAAKATVKVIWSREDDMTNDFYRPCSLHQFRAHMAHDGKISGWEHHIAGPSIMENIVANWLPAMVPEGLPQFMKRAGGKLARSFISMSGKDDTSVEGAADLAYEFPDRYVSYAVLKQGLPVGFWRSVGHSFTACAVECFVDEIITAEKADPIAWRLQHLPKDHPRRPLLEHLRQSKDWTAPLEPNEFRGIAAHSCFGSHCAQIVTIKWEQQKLQVKKVLAVVDCGLAISPDQIKAQVESAVIFGLSAALYGEITFVNGQVKETNFDTYPVVRMQESPEIEVMIMPSDKDPTGIGEPGLPPVAPALLNAFFQASGQRIRKLPLMKQIEG